MAKLEISNGVIIVSLDVISFKEGDVNIIYSPSLDISGYGYTEAEAKRSFEIVYGEHLRFSKEKDSY